MKFSHKKRILWSRFVLLQHIGIHIMDVVGVTCYLAFGHVEEDGKAVGKEFGRAHGVKHDELAHDGVCCHLVQLAAAEVEYVLIVLCLNMSNAFLCQAHDLVESCYELG